MNIRPPVSSAALVADWKINQYTITFELDGGVAEVISLEAESKTYEGDGDINVPMTVGLGHLPGHDEYDDDVKELLA